MHKLAESEDFTERLVHYLIKTLTFAMPTAFCVKQKDEKAVTSEAKSSNNVSQEIPVQEEITPPSILTGRSKESSKTSKDDVNSMKK